MATKQLEVVITGDSKGARRAMGEAGRSADTMSKKFAGVGKKLAIGLGAGLVGAGIAFSTFVADGFEVLANLERINTQTETVIKSTGKAAGISAKQVEDYAHALELKTGIEQESIQEGQNLLLTFTNIQNKVGEGNDIFNQATDIMADMSVALGTDAKGSAIQLGKALNDPIKGISALTKVGVSFTDQQKKQVKALAESGDVLGAQKIILAELNRQFGGSAEAFGNTTSGKVAKLKNAFGDVQEELAAKLLPVGLKLLTWASKELPKAMETGRKAVDVIRSFFSDDGGGVGAGAESTFGRVRTAVENVVAAVRLHWPEIQRIVSEVMLTVQTTVASVTSAVQTIWANFGENIMTVVKGAWNNVRQIIGGQLEIVRGIFTAFAALLKGDWSGVWDGIKMIVHGAFNVIIGIVKNAGELLRLAATVTLETMHAAWKAGWDGIQKIPGLAWEGIKIAVAAGVAWLVSQIVSLPSKIKSASAGMFDGIKEAFRSALNWIVRKWNDFEIKVPGIDPPGPGPKLSGFTVGMPQLPEFHTGGTIPGATGREVPIMGLAGERVLSIPQTRAYESGRGGGTSTIVRVNVVVQGSVTSERELGKSLAPIIATEINRNSRTTGRSQVQISARSLTL